MSRLLLEEEKVLLEQEESSKAFLSVYNRVPYALIREEAGSNSTEVLEEIREICKYYKIYKKGKSFNVEGTNGDYIPARLRYKMSATLINKEARFLFAEQPDITVDPKGDTSVSTEESERALTILNDLVKTVLRKNNFQDILIKGARDCFIGKRVGCLVNFNEEDGITITFLPSVQFLYKVRPTNHTVIEKFVSFTVLEESRVQVDKRIFKKKYDLQKEDGKDHVYLEEIIYDGTGRKIEVVRPRSEIKEIDFIPAVVFVNDGLTEELSGESEIESLMDFEEWYSKLSNADSDAERKSMNPTKYVVDMANNSTKNLSTAAGAFWDLGSDQNLQDAHTMVGLLEPKMSYHEALKVSLDRIKTTGYEQVDMPNITNESLSGVITSGKALKAIYWPLIVRCKEKMKMWGAQISTMVDIIIKGAMAFPKTISRYTDDILMPVSYEINVVQNTPLPEDEIEEKTTDLAEVETNVLSRRSYMKKWRNLTDEAVLKELNQIAFERQIIEDSFYSGSVSNGMNGDNNVINALNKDDFTAAGVNSLRRDGTQGKSSSIEGVHQNVTEGGQNVQNVVSKLNGTQINSLVSILSSYKSGLFTKVQAKQLIMAMGMDATFADVMLEEEGKGGGILNV